MNENRPVNLDLSTMKFPVTAIASITHRITGVAIFFALPILLWMLDRSLASPESFAALQSSVIVKLLAWGISAVLLYHLVAGIRHLIMDGGVGETLEGGRRGATAVFIISAVLIVIIGGWIW